MKIQISIRRISNPALILVALAACNSGGTSGGVSAPVTQTSTGSANTGYTCAYTELDSIPVGQDPTQNFSVSNIVQTSSIVTSTCTGLSVAPVSHTYSAVSRSGSVITTVDSNGSDPMTLSNNQATVSQSDLIACSGGVQANGTFTELELDPINGIIRLYSNWTLLVNGCTSVSAPAGQSAPAPIVKDYVPSTDTSSYLVAISVGTGSAQNASYNSLSYNQSQCTTFEAFGTNTIGSSISVQCNPGLAFWFEFPTGTAPAVGIYSTLTTPVSNQQAKVEYEYGSTGGVSNYGYLNVTNLQFDQSGTVSSFAADFELFSGNVQGAPTYGTVRYNSPYP